MDKFMLIGIFVGLVSVVFVFAIYDVATCGEKKLCFMCKTRKH